VPINKAAKKARLTPAIADERNPEVYFQYRVEFIKKGDEAIVNVYPNPGVQRTSRRTASTTSRHSGQSARKNGRTCVRDALST
jgi:hypothetical protein